jgi:hypothetical protein
MSESATKPSREQLLELAKSLRDEARDSELQPLDAAKALGAAIRTQIADHQAELVKMRSLEVQTLKKNLPPVATAPAPAPVKEPTVFDLLKRPLGAPPAVKSESFIDTDHKNDPEKRLTDGSAPGSVTPEDKDSKEVPAEGSGGEIKKEELEKDLASATAELRTQNKLLGAANQMRAPKFGGGTPASVHPHAPRPPQAPGAAPSLHRSEANVFDILSKGDFGFGDNGKVATSPAQAGAAKAPQAPKPQFTMAHLQAAKAKLAGAKVGTATLPKPPATMEQKKPNSYADLTPPGARFGKAEFDGEECPYCKKALKDCSCA